MQYEINETITVKCPICGRTQKTKICELICDCSIPSQELISPVTNKKDYVIGKNVVNGCAKTYCHNTIEVLAGA